MMAVRGHDSSLDWECNTSMVSSTSGNSSDEESDSKCLNQRDNATATSLSPPDANAAAASPPLSSFSVGDHVYQSCSFAGIPGVFRHHGIVVRVVYVNAATAQGRSAAKEDDSQDTIASYQPPSSSEITDNKISSSSNDDNHHHAHAAEAVCKLWIADFSKLTSRISTGITLSSSLSSSSHPTKKSLSDCISDGQGCIRVYETNASEWHVVDYGSLHRNSINNDHNCHHVKCDPPFLVQARVHFLLDHSNQVLPDYHLLRNNCECVAVWCKTGQWGTLQAIRGLSFTALSQVGLATTGAGVAAGTTVSVPSAGLWGWLGYTTQVSLLTAQPWLLPAIAVCGVAAVAVPAVTLWHAQRHWKDMTQRLHEAFWQDAAVGHTDVVVHCIKHFSKPT